MSDEIQAAAKRVLTARQVCERNGLCPWEVGDVYGSCGTIWRYIADLEVIAKAYGLEHPADEHEPIDDIGTIVSKGDVRVEISITGAGRIDIQMKRRENGWEWVYLCDVKTRGDVRRLLAALGITQEAK